MKKIIILFLLLLLVGCETSVEPEMGLDESVGSVQLPEEEVEPEVIEEVTQFEEESSDSVDDTPVEEDEEEIEIVPEPSQVFEDLFVESWFSEGIGNYVTFRILDDRDLRLYFKGGHEIHVTPDLNVRNDQPFLIYEAVEAAGQFLSKYPLSFIRAIDQLLIVGNNSSLVIKGSRATIGSMYLLRSYNNLNLLQGFSLPIIKGDINSIKFDFNLWNLVLDELSSYKDYSKLDATNQVKEIYFAYLLQETGLLPAEFMEDFSPYLLLFSEMYLEEEEFLLTSSLEPQLPNNISLNIQMREFYDVIPDNAPSTFESIIYNGIQNRYYERVELPQGCPTPNHCPQEAKWDPNYQWEVHQFTVSFGDGDDIEFNVSSDTTIERAEFVAREFAIAYGRVVGVLRGGLKAVLIIDGVSNVWGGPYHGWGTTLTNCGECDVFRWDKFEELIMHELVHSTIDYRPQWFDHFTGQLNRSGRGLITIEEWDSRAVKPDGFKMDQYSIDVPLEDRAQTMLFYAAYRLYPDSVSELTRDVLEQMIPNRIKTFDELLGFN